MSKLCDLHTHSLASDGSYTPSEIIDAAVALNLSAVALTDHNCIDGLPEFLEAASGKPIEAICGSEFSVDYDGIELHLHGLYIPTSYFAQVSDFTRDIINKKEQSNLALIDSLKKEGIILDYKAIKNSTPNGNVNRKHIAIALTSLGYTQSDEEAFNTLLSEQSGHYKPQKRVTLWEMIDFIRSIHAAPILAHPLKELSPPQLEKLLIEAKSQGLMGLECTHSDYTPSHVEFSLDITQRLNLLPSGGSDFHGIRKTGIYLGCGRNNVSVPYQWAINIKNALK